MKSIVEQLSNYKSVHLNKKNIRTHFIGIPMIIWSAAVMLATINFQFTLDGGEISFTLATAICLFIGIYYFILSKPLALLTFVLFGPLIYSAQLVANVEHPFILAISIFVIGWIFQYIGHAYEKAKPAFYDDLNQLLIGPIFLMAEIYFALGFGQKMDKEVHVLAVEKRQTFERNKRAVTG